MNRDCRLTSLRPGRDLFWLSGIQKPPAKQDSLGDLIDAWGYFFPAGHISSAVKVFRQAFHCWRRYFDLPGWYFDSTGRYFGSEGRYFVVKLCYFTVLTEIRIHDPLKIFYWFFGFWINYNRGLWSVISKPCFQGHGDVIHGSKARMCWAIVGVEPVVCIELFFQTSHDL